MDKMVREGWRDLLESKVTDETWFCTLYFPFDMEIASKKRNIKTWLGRIGQSLKEDFKSISNRPSDGLWAIVVHSPSNTHAHLLVNAKGLSKLDKGRWEGRWTEIMNYKGRTCTCKIRPAWKGPKGAASYMTEWFNLEDGSEIWFRGVIPRTSGNRQD